MSTRASKSSGRTSTRAGRSPRSPGGRSPRTPNRKSTGSAKKRSSQQVKPTKKKDGQHKKGTMSVNVLPPIESEEATDSGDEKELEQRALQSDNSNPGSNVGSPSGKFSLGKLRINIGGRNSRSQPSSPMQAIEALRTPMATVIPDVVAVGVFVNRQLILKVFSEDGMEGAFRAAYKGYANQCVDFLKESDKNRKLEIKNFDIGDPYSMFKSEVGDKELVFLVWGTQDHGYPTINTLHQIVTTILHRLRPDGSGNASVRRDGSSSSRARADSRRATLQGLSSIEEVFRTMDLEGTGEIDLAEFQTGLQMLGVDWTDKQISKIFEQIDTEENGSISYSDFMRFMMKPTNKKNWKELKRAINASIAVPSYKQMLKDNIDPDDYRKKLSQVEKLVNIMEQAMIEECEPEEELVWRNKITAHREFIRRYQDVVGKAMGEENSRLKKRLSQMEKDSKSISAMSPAMSGRPSLKSPRSNTERRSSSTPRTPKSGEVDQEALIKRLRRENQELKRKVKTKDKEMDQLKIDTRRKERPVTPSRKQTTTLDPEAMEQMIQKLRKELKDAKRERDELRQENKELDTQLNAATDKIALLDRSGGTDDALVAQLQRAKKETKQMRAQRNELRNETVKLKNIDASLRTKMSKLTKKLMDVDDKMAKQVFDATDVDNMLNVLVDQLHEMAGRYEKVLIEYEKLKKRYDNLEEEHEREKNRLQDEIDRLKREMRNNEDKVIDLEQELNAKDLIIDGLQLKLRETDDMYDENKRLKRDLADRDDELQQLRLMNEQIQSQVAEEQDKTKKFEKQVKMIVKMPTSSNWNKQVQRLFKIFNRLDRNKDGKLDFDEFQAGADELGFGSMEFEQKAAFDDMDKNGDGFVDFDDFKDACMKIMHGKEKQSDSEWQTVRTLLTKPPGHWSAEDAGHWLNTIGMDQYSDNFKDDNVDGRTLLLMNADDLRNLGITKKRDLRKIQRELADLKKRDDVVSNLQYENEKLKDELQELKTNGPTWDAVRTLQTRIRGLEGQLRQERHAREQIMFHVKDELKNDSRFNSLDPESEDMLAEVAVLKGALADANKKLKNEKQKKPRKGGSAYENDAKVEDALDHNVKPIGRFLQKWYVLANHSTQYWVSRTNKEIKEQAELWKKEQLKINGGQEITEEEALELGKTNKMTEVLNWILYDARRDRVVQEVRMRGRGLDSDPKDVQVQMSVSPSGPWTSVADAKLAKSPHQQIIGGFKAESRFWRIGFMTNYGEEDPDAPRWVMYEVQFWGPMDEDVENEHFVIE